MRLEVAARRCALALFVARRFQVSFLQLNRCVARVLPVIAPPCATLVLSVLAPPCVVPVPRRDGACRRAWKRCGLLTWRGADIGSRRHTCAWGGLRHGEQFDYSQFKWKLTIGTILELVVEIRKELEPPEQLLKIDAAGDALHLIQRFARQIECRSIAGRRKQHDPAHTIDQIASKLAHVSAAVGDLGDHP